MNLRHRIRISSITARLILGLTLATTILWCGAATYSTYISYRELNEAFDRALHETAWRILPLAADDLMGHDGHVAHADHDGRALRHFAQGRREYFSYQLRDASGRIILRTHDAPAQPYDQTADPGFSTAGDYRLFTDTDKTTGLTITVAETTKDRNARPLRALSPAPSA